ncbi:MAG: transposase family protein [Euryarchaeota archaeon]|nr:transposase family protein [Euryarchaeota archaeon]
MNDLNHKKLSRKPRLFKTFTGFNQEEFDRVYEKVKEGHDEYERKRLDRKDRKRAIGAGRKFELDLRERFLLLLIYYCTYITYTLVGFLFDVDGSTVWRNINHLERLVKEYTPLKRRWWIKWENCESLICNPCAFIPIE